jgi:ParB family chromosome partitioning protein
MSPRIHDVGMEILIDPERVHPFKNQPRKYFGKKGLEELAGSIEASGQLQPATVKILCGEGDDTEYELIDGERRWRSCLLRGIPLRAVIRHVESEKKQHLHSAVSNFGREDHTPLEIAHALAKIRVDFGLTQAELGKYFGKSTGWAAQHLSLLKLHPEVQKLMSPELPESAQLSFSVALMLITWPVEEQVVMATKVVKSHWKLQRTRYEMRKKAQQLGFPESRGKRPRRPHSDYNILVSFLQRISEDAELLLDLKAKRFDEMFASRSDIERARMIKNVRDCIDSLTLIQLQIDRSAQAKKLGV